MFLVIKCVHVLYTFFEIVELLLGVKKSTSSMAVYSETGRYHLYINRYVRMIKCLENLLKNRYYHNKNSL